MLGAFKYFYNTSSMAAWYIKIESVSFCGKCSKKKIVMLCVKTRVVVNLGNNDRNHHPAY
jgi:hypothetical protein